MSSPRSRSWRRAIDLRGAIRRRRAAELTVDPLIDTVAEFGATVGDSVGKTYNVANSRAERFLKHYMQARVDLINATTRKAVQRALAADDPQAEIRKVFSQARANRARMIAETEVVRASNFGAIDAGKWVAELDFKRFASLMDGEERHTHHEMHDQVKPWLEDFVSPSGAKGLFPGEFGVPEEDINCRCAAVPARAAQQRQLGEYGDAVELYDNVRAPFVVQLEQAWQRVFDEQEAAVLAELE